MQKLLYLLIPIFLLAGCFSSSPYLLRSDLPERIQYYTANKQFNVTPNWYWRVRPSKEIQETVGFKFLTHKNPNYKNDKAKVIGELKDNNEKYYVAHWKSQGYFFIKKDDYDISEKFKKYLVPLNYESDSFRHGHEHQLIAYYQDTNLQYIGGLPAYVFNDATKSGLNLVPFLKLTFYRTILMNRINTNKYSHLVNQTLQIAQSTGFSNQFIKFTQCPLFKEFSKDESVYSIEFIAAKHTTSKQYTNQYGQLFIGHLLETKYIILKRGPSFYALPCE